MRTVFLYLIVAVAFMVIGCENTSKLTSYENGDLPYLGILPPKGYSGLWVTYNFGVVSKEESYLNGKRHGICRIWDQDGKLEAVCEFKHGKPWTGKWIFQFVEEENIPDVSADDVNLDYEIERFFLQGHYVVDPELERKKKNASLPPSGQTAPAETPPCQPTQ